MLLILGRHGKAAHNQAYELHQAAYAAREQDLRPRESRSDRGATLMAPTLASHYYPQHGDFAAPLIDSGVRQARSAGRYMRQHGYTPDIVCVSPLLRTMETWRAYGFNGIPARVEPRLREQDGGLFDRRPLGETEDLRRKYADEARRSIDAQPPDGESIRRHRYRVESWLRETVVRYGEEGCAVLAVTHYGSIGLLGALCEGIDERVYLQARPPEITPGYGDLLAYRYHPRAGSWTREFVFRNPAR